MPNGYYQPIAANRVCSPKQSFTLRALEKMTDSAITPDGGNLWVIPLDNFKPRDYFVRGSAATIALLVLIYFSQSTASPDVIRYFIYIGLSVSAAALGYSLATRIERTELDFEKGEIRQFRALPILPGGRHFRLSEFSTVLSRMYLSRSGIITIDVSLTGRHRTIKLAEFGSVGVFQDAGTYDQTEAQALRKRIAARLQYRDLGVI